MTAVLFSLMCVLAARVRQWTSSILCRQRLRALFLHARLFLDRSYIHCQNPGQCVV